jgi:hypothetical protein
LPPASLIDNNKKAAKLPFRAKKQRSVWQSVLVRNNHIMPELTHSWTYLVVYPAGREAKTPAMNKEDVNHCSGWLLYLQ